MHHSMCCKTALALALISLELIALTTAEPSLEDAAKMSEPSTPPSVTSDPPNKPPLDLASILMGPKDSRHSESSPQVKRPATNSNPQPAGDLSVEDFPKRILPSSVMDNFDGDNFVKVFTYDAAPELDVPRNESVAYLLEVMTEVNEHIDKLILQAAKEVAEYYTRVLAESPEGETVEQTAPGELYDLVFDNLRALLGTLDDYPLLKESLYLWSTSDDDDDDVKEANSTDGATGRDFTFSMKKHDREKSSSSSSYAPPPKFVCPDYMTELVNCVSYDVLDTVSDSAKYYFNPFSW